MSDLHVTRDPLERDRLAAEGWTQRRSPHPGLWVLEPPVEGQAELPGVMEWVWPRYREVVRRRADHPVE